MATLEEFINEQERSTGSALPQFDAGMDLFVEREFASQVPDNVRGLVRKEFKNLLANRRIASYQEAIDTNTGALSSEGQLLAADIEAMRARWTPVIQAGPQAGRGRRPRILREATPASIQLADTLMRYDGRWNTGAATGARAFLEAMNSIPVRDFDDPETTGIAPKPPGSEVAAGAESLPRGNESLPRGNPETDDGFLVEAGRDIADFARVMGGAALREGNLAGVGIDLASSIDSFDGDRDEDGFLYRSQQWLERAEQNVEGDVQLDTTALPYEIARATGQIGGMALGFFVGKKATLATKGLSRVIGLASSRGATAGRITGNSAGKMHALATGVGLGALSQSEDYLAEASDEVKNDPFKYGLSLALGGSTGLLESVLPIGIASRYGLGVGRGVRAALGRSAGSAVVEGGTEIAQGSLQNVIAQQLYDEDRQVFDLRDAMREGSVGGAAGFIAELGGQLSASILGAKGKRPSLHFDDLNNIVDNANPTDADGPPPVTGGPQAADQIVDQSNDVTLDRDSRLPASADILYQTNPNLPAQQFLNNPPGQPAADNLSADGINTDSATGRESSLQSITVDELVQRYPIMTQGGTDEQIQTLVELYPKLKPGFDMYEETVQRIAQEKARTTPDEAQSMLDSVVNGTLWDNYGMPPAQQDLVNAAVRDARAQGEDAVDGALVGLQRAIATDGDRQKEYEDLSFAIAGAAEHTGSSTVIAVDPVVGGVPRNSVSQSLIQASDFRSRKVRDDSGIRSARAVADQYDAASNSETFQIQALRNFGMQIDRDGQPLSLDGKPSVQAGRRRRLSKLYTELVNDYQINGLSGVRDTLRRRRNNPGWLPEDRKALQTYHDELDAILDSATLPTTQERQARKDGQDTGPGRDFTRSADEGTRRRAKLLAETTIIKPEDVPLKARRADELDPPLLIEYKPEGVPTFDEFNETDFADLVVDVQRAGMTEFVNGDILNRTPQKLVDNTHDLTYTNDYRAPLGGGKEMNLKPGDRDPRRQCRGK